MILGVDFGVLIFVRDAVVALYDSTTMVPEELLASLYSLVASPYSLVASPYSRVASPYSLVASPCSLIASLYSLVASSPDPLRRKGPKGGEICIRWIHMRLQS